MARAHRRWVLLAPTAAAASAAPAWQLAALATLDWNMTLTLSLYPPCRHPAPAQCCQQEDVWGARAPCGVGL